jgi:hypothetical protein
VPHLSPSLTGRCGGQKELLCQLQHPPHLASQPEQLCGQRGASPDHPTTVVRRGRGAGRSTSSLGRAIVLDGCLSRWVRRAFALLDHCLLQPSRLCCTLTLPSVKLVCMACHSEPCSAYFWWCCKMCRQLLNGLGVGGRHERRQPASAWDRALARTTAAVFAPLSHASHSLISVMVHIVTVCCGASLPYCRFPSPTATMERSDSWKTHFQMYDSG